MTARLSSRRSFLHAADGPLGHLGSLEAYGHMLTDIRGRVQKEKQAGRTLAEVQAARPSAEFDADWGKGRLAPNDFVAIVYDTVR